jgi:hypothetical protein
MIQSRVSVERFPSCILVPLLVDAFFAGYNLLFYGNNS